MIHVFDDMVFPDHEKLVKLLLTNATDNQSKTQVNMNKLDGTLIYSPQKYGVDDYRDYMNWINESNPGGAFITHNTNVWGLVYAFNGIALPHQHFNHDLAGVHYLEADEGCGFLVCKDGDEIVEIEPKKNRMVIMSGSLFHWVMPGENPESRRIAMAFSARLQNDQS